jgi:multiple sugar transport system permease protein
MPLYVMITSAVKPLGDVQGAFTWWPTTITIQPFIDMWTTVPLAQYFFNSVIVSTIATLFSLVIAIFASFAVSRYRFRGRSVFTTTVLSTQMFPGVLFLLPLYLIFININQTFGIQLAGTRLGLIITYLTFTLPFSIWMLAGYFDNIPRELDEAARVDGSSAIGALFRVILPVARPGVVAVGVYSFMTAWGELLFASVLTTQESRTLAVGLGEYSTQVNIYWNQIMAASLVVSIPVVIGFLLLQRSFVAGLTAGAVK